MMDARIIVDVFPGWGLLSRPWREAGFPVLWGPDLLFGETVEEWPLPLDVAWGLVGGPPCQAFSIARSGAAGPLDRQCRDMTPEFVRLVKQGEPQWFLMENVRQAPIPRIDGYRVQPMLLDSADFGCYQSRVRRFTYGTRDGTRLAVPESLASNPAPVPCILAPRGGGRRSSFEKRMQRQITIPDLLAGAGLPVDTPTPWAFTKRGWGQVLANAVPLSVGRALRDAVLEAHGMGV